MQTEPEEIARRYERRARHIDASRYSPMNWDVLLSWQERQRNLVRLLRDLEKPPADLRVLEVGCGSGRNLVELLALGFNPAKLVGVDLLPARVSEARRVLPAAVRVIQGDASEIGAMVEGFDIVYQSTVFTSLLDEDFQRKLAITMWQCVAPGGGVLWYDFIFDNPANPDVRGVPLKRIAELFPRGKIRSRRVTLAPPISRRICRISPASYHVVNCLPWLRSHVLCWISKARQ